MTDWLKNRLTKAKQKHERWAEFAEVLQQYWEENFDPALQSLENLRSIYTTDDAGLKKRLIEWGDFFHGDSLLDEDKPLAVAWRKLELAFKDTAYIVELALKRKFPTMPVEWVPLYHRKDQPYGYEFISRDRLLAEGRDIADYFLTSHGTVNTTTEDLAEFGIALQEFAQQAYEQIVRIKPLHIVYQGVQVYEEINFNIYMSTLTRAGAEYMIGLFAFEVDIEDETLNWGCMARSGGFVEIGAYPEA